MERTTATIEIVIQAYAKFKESFMIIENFDEFDEKLHFNSNSKDEDKHWERKPTPFSFTDNQKEVMKKT